MKRLTALCLCILGLSGCNWIRLAYNQLDWWIPYRLGTYIEFTSAQRIHLDHQLSTVLKWHCHSQLPRYAALIRTTNDEFQNGAVDHAILTKRSQEIGEFWREILDQAEPGISDILLTANDDQVDHLFTVIEEQNAKWLEDFENKSKEDVRDDYRENMTEEIERWFGPLEEDQVDAVREWSNRVEPLGMLGFDMRRRWQKQFRAVFDLRGNPRAFHAAFKSLLQFSDPDQPEALTRRLASNEELILSLLQEVGSTLSPKQKEHLAHFSADLAEDLEEIDCET